ncbi:hypothetical protein H0H92_010643 [Tricholoma furcatifolium]|nr:hypothetical protein H0H92_010643 [Tricholoma furcatifolium]
MGSPSGNVLMVLANIIFPGTGPYTAFGIPIPQTVQNAGDYFIYATNGSDIDEAWAQAGPLTINAAAISSTTATTGASTVVTPTATSSFQTSANSTTSTTTNSATNTNTISAQGSPSPTQGTSQNNSTAATSNSHLKVLIGAIIGRAAILAFAVIIAAYFARRQRHPRRKGYKYSGVDIDPQIIAASVVTPFSDESQPQASEELLVPPTYATHGLTPQPSVSSLQEKTTETVSDSTSLQTEPISGPSTSSGMSSASSDPGPSGSIVPPLKHPNQPLLVVGDLDTDAPPEYSPSPFHSFEPPLGKRS